MHVSAAHQGSEPVVNQEESNGKLPPCVHCQESDNGSLSSPRVVLNLMELSTFQTYPRRICFAILGVKCITLLFYLPTKIGLCCESKYFVLSFTSRAAEAKT